jgi:PA domain-containing protein/Calx-beta domain-containing protein
MKNKFLNKLAGAFLVLMVICVASSTAFASTIVIQNNDSAGVGFNDPTPVPPIGGNSGTTLGQQRLIAFQAAANIWGATLVSVPTITIRASWVALPCTANSATLGSAGNSGNIWRDFPGAVPGTWYGNALANAISGSDRNGATAEISAQFNLNVGTTGCLENASWYYGLDNNHGPTGIDLVAVLMHEFAHGLGFQSFTNSSTGAQAFGQPSIYDRFLFDNNANKTWPQMTDGERAASAINTGKLAWNGSQVDSDAAGVLSGTPRLRVNSPPAIAGNYQIGAADFGPLLSSPGITANVVQATPNDGCSALTNPGAMSGKIALIDRGTCAFITKVKNAQNAGAVGVIIADNVVNSIPPGMGGSDPTITIPSVSITQADGNTIKGQLPNVNATLFIDGSTIAGTDQVGRPLMFTPNPVQSGSSVSHWDSSALPDQLMEPNISGTLNHSVSPPQDLTASLMKDIGWQTTIVAASTVYFQSAAVSVNEGSGTAQITVNRSDTSAAATVNYATSDTAGLTPCTTFNGRASERCDYATSVGTVRFAVGEPSKSFIIPIVDDAHIEGNETFTVSLTAATGAVIGSPQQATVTIVDNATPVQNPIDVTDFYVTQLYIDFLGRLPDQTGFNNWTATINGCPGGGFGTANPTCDRVHAGVSFYQSDEFQTRGYFVYKFYEVAFGRRADYGEFIPDMAEVGGPKSPAEEAAAKLQYMNAFILRPEFTKKYPMTDPTQYVDALLATAGVPNLPIRGTLISNLQSGGSRAQTVRDIVESPEVENRFYYRGFVSMMYFGFVRRNPDQTGFDNYLVKLTQTNDPRAMAFDFIYSTEYRGRFGPP